MPCNDITENIEIVLDKNDCLKTYRLNKKTCGGAVGVESFLLDRLRNKTVARILEYDPEFSGGHHRPEDHAEEFVALKHLHAVKSTLEVYTGDASGAIGDPCTIAGVSIDGDDTIIDAQIDIRLITERIRACAHCGPG